MLSPGDVSGLLAQKYIESSYYTKSLDPFLRWILQRHADCGGVTEIRILGYGAFNGRWVAYLDNNFDRIDNFVKTVLPTWNKPRTKLTYNDWPRLGEANFYFTLNPVHPDCFARSAWEVTKAKTTATDNDILGYSLLAIDVDPVRKSGISSTEEEKADALIICNHVREWFAGHGAESIRGNSGNGWHLLFSQKLLDEKKLVATEYQQLLEYLQEQFGNEKASIDVSIFNPSRIFKLYGSKAIKGSSTEERPHRWSSIDLSTIPKENDVFALIRPTITDWFQKKKSVTDNPEQSNKSPQPTSSKNNSKWTPGQYVEVLEGILAESGLKYRKQDHKSGRQMYVFEICPYHTDHDDDTYECCVMADPVKGGYSAKCHHDENAGWKEFKGVIGWDKHRESVMKRMGLWKESRKSQRYKERAHTVPDEDDGIVIEDKKKIMEEFNRRHCVVLHGNDAVVINEYFDQIEKRNQVRFLSKNAFQLFYENRKVRTTNHRGDKIVMPAGQFWIRHNGRKTYEQVVFDPSESCDSERVYNLWKGWPIKPVEGCCDKYLAHMLNVICGGDLEYCTWLNDWMADIIQNPCDRKGTVVVLKGGQGAGKSLFVDIFGKLFGSYYIYVTQGQQITGKFNSALANALLVHGAEFMWAGDKQAQNALKGLVTDKYIMVEHKHKDPIMLRNHMRLFISSNEIFVVPAEMDDRRFFVLDVSTEKSGDKDYFKAILDEMKNGGYEALMEHFMNWTITSDLRHPPDTAAKILQKHLAAKPEEEWFYQCLLEGKFSQHEEEWVQEQVSYQLYQYFTTYLGIRNIGYRPSPTALGIMLFKILKSELRKGKVNAYRWQEIDGQREKITERKRGYIFPSLERCRELYDEYSGNKEEWPEEEYATLAF